MQGEDANKNSRKQLNQNSETSDVIVQGISYHPGFNLMFSFLNLFYVSSYYFKYINISTKIKITQSWIIF